MDLLALADFTLVARHEGFGRAARAAGRPKATLSRRVAELEAALDLRLFERGGRALKLTEEGRALYARTSRLLLEIEEATTAIAAGGEIPRGRLRVSAPLLFSQTAMGRIAADFALTYPEVQLEVTTEDRPVDMVEEGVDLVIRVNPDPDESLVGRAFLHDRLVVVSRPEMLDADQAGPVPAVVRTKAERSAWRLKTPNGPRVLDIDPVLSLSSMIMLRDAVLMGVGAGRLPLSLVGNEISKGTLVSWGNVDVPDIALWALYPSRRLLSARVSAFLETLRQAFPKGTPDELAAYVQR
ncbi:LysR family transcriptional regulator [Mesobaculum littorinae]|uniref:LysR family transcriptional regulator n=1 Tax=Mesobaculum littorinae TaxID=2486419 RepID=A0A438AER7_9RHOB|nr:LysR family transcriptional regulator [Mesobaculum littorinae]RVV97172.1 LysR family transcriptional regulator [Mesobaculum littorinae]